MTCFEEAVAHSNRGAIDDQDMAMTASNWHQTMPGSFLGV